MGIKHNTLTDGSYTAVNDDTGHDCGHRHKTYAAAERCWQATSTRRQREPVITATLFGKQLKSIRVSSGISQEVLGNASGMSRQAIDLLEKGRRQPSLETAERLAIALGKKLRIFEGCGIELPVETP